MTPPPPNFGFNPAHLSALDLHRLKPPYPPCIFYHAYDHDGRPLASLDILPLTPISAAYFDLAPPLLAAHHFFRSQVTAIRYALAGFLYSLAQGLGEHR